ncbi:DUF4135 domain-containing protein [Lactococcus hircilactis]|uniref:DUF4135 domain-containing protein n=1 Tax=Lactococcus hircilactis TaxID=1494462 RepID=A0A7X1Z6A8_9LACT|nr:DUF4135 domain-containing protein [Lactococcus hircilactis]MQW38345.1 DUF4135 domain-containing protein [Lactococcus hircilactis]
MENYDAISGVFDNYYLPQIEKIEKQLSMSYQRYFGNSKFYCNDQCKKTIISEILKYASEVCAYSLIDFYNFKKKNATSLSYALMNSSWKNLETMTEFNLRYPLVKEKLDIIINLCLERVSEVFEVLSTHEDDIIDFLGNFGPKKQKINVVNAFMGDYHKEHFVAVVKINDKKIVIKKRSITGERILDVFDKIFNLKLPKTKILSENLLIQEFVPYSPTPIENLPDYYFYFGFMGAIFTFLGAKDLHSGNVIATSEKPTFLDLEVPITQETSSYSLLKETLIFNCNEKKKVYGDIDLSSFSGGRTTEMGYSIAGKGTNDISISIISVTQNDQNIPFDGINPYEYANDFVRGFKEGYQKILTNKERLIAELGKISNYSYRFILRNTGFYGKYIHDLHLPVHMQDRQAFNDFLDLLVKKSKQNNDVVREEIDCLDKGIIPYFTTDFFGLSSQKIKESFLRRLEKQDSAFFSRELEYLSLFLWKAGKKLQLGNPKNHFHNNRIEAEIKRFSKFAIVQDKFRYGCLDLSVQDRVLDNRNDLYMFGLSLYFVYKMNYGKQVNDKIVKTVLEGKINKEVSGLVGYQSNLLLKHLFGLNEKEYISSEKIIKEEYGIVDFSNYGTALLILDKMYEDTGDDRYLSDIKFLGKIYVEKTNQENLTGLLHGYSGDIMTYIILGKYFSFDLMLGNVIECLYKEDGFFDENSLNWKDTRKGMKKNLSALSYGGPGIILSRLFLLCSLLNQPKTEDMFVELRVRLESDIRQGIEGILSKNREKYVDDTLVNGYSGALIVLYFTVKVGILEDTGLEERIFNYITTGVNLLQDSGWRCQGLDNLYTPCFFNGTMGITFTLWILSGKSSMEKALVDYIKNFHKK